MWIAWYPADANICDESLAFPCLTLIRAQVSTPRMFLFQSTLDANRPAHASRYKVTDLRFGMGLGLASGTASEMRFAVNVLRARGASS